MRYDSQNNIHEFVGTVGIGTTSLGSHKLAVNGTIRAKEVSLETSWSDDIFAGTYNLAALSKVERYIKSEKHLPGMPAASEVAAEGLNAGETEAKLVAKVGELTLYIIEQERCLNAQAERITRLEQGNATSHQSL